MHKVRATELVQIKLSAIILSCTESDDSRKDSSDTKPKAQPRSHNAPLEANVIQSSLLSATAPLVSASLINPQGGTPSATQGSLSGDESGVYNENALPVSFLICLNYFTPGKFKLLHNL